ncbi:hypothetical protein TNCT_76141 [Trichonephila clavata]|uniref:Uncharacterized protein n=1 Tax=Trichonephila clavata TaxID=2740835 RepID=A0A8X6L145_TRICU|nr:hypothetical protein TNCT_76141 [Trichonephila clavata]
MATACLFRSTIPSFTFAGHHASLCLVCVSNLSMWSSSLRLLAAVGGYAWLQLLGALPASHFWSDHLAQVPSVEICGSSRNGQDCHHSDLPFVSEILNINKDAQQNSFHCLSEIVFY